MENTNKHTAIFIGEIHEKLYECEKENYTPWGIALRYKREEILEISSKSRKIGTKRFYECEIDNPPLDVNDKFYINELDLEVTVLDKMRSANGETIYHVDHIFEVIENENTELSLAEAQKVQNEQIELAKEFVLFDIDKTVKEKVETELKRKKEEKKWYKFFK